MEGRAAGGGDAVAGGLRGLGRLSCEIRLGPGGICDGAPAARAGAGGSGGPGGEHSICACFREAAAEPGGLDRAGAEGCAGWREDHRDGSWPFIPPPVLPMGMRRIAVAFEAFQDHGVSRASAKCQRHSEPPRVPAFVDELPEVLRFREFLVFANRHLRAEEEVREGALGEHAVDDDRAVLHLEIEAMVLRAKAIELLAVALQLSKTFAIEGFEVLFGNLELIEQFELLQGPELGDFGSADFVEDDLEHGREFKCEVTSGKWEV